MRACWSRTWAGCPRSTPRSLWTGLWKPAHIFELMSESFYLTIHTIDMFLDPCCSSSGLQRCSLPTSKRRSRGLWSMVFIHIADSLYSGQQIHVSLVRFAKVAGSDKEGTAPLLELLPPHCMERNQPQG